jgi:sialic acid synthase SpsE
MHTIKNIRIGNRLLGDGQPVYTVAEIGSNFDGSLDQAKKLVDLAKTAGADAVKFQSFLADKIVSEHGFRNLKVSFQSKWKKSVYEVYKDAEFPREWHQEIADYCRKKKITFLSTPYDKEAVDLLDEIGVPAFKVGSGDINFLFLIEYMAKKGKPMIVGTGASTLGEIEEAVNVIRDAGNEDIILLQCVTNYLSPVEQANIRAMVTLREAFQVNVGYSDHARGYLVPLCAVALGACLIEKHFTFDKMREGPDHPFAMDVPEFTEMVNNIRLVEKALGSYIKRPVPAEDETISIQRRCIYSKEDILKGTIITRNMLTLLRPDKGLKPKFMDIVVGRRAQKDIPKGTAITWGMI